MANLSKIKLNGTEYELKDAIARTNISALENAGYQTSAQVSSAIASAIGNISTFDVAIVSNLNNVDNPNAHTIYFISNSSSGENIYDEYMYINNNWELIGSTQIDLSNYLQTTDIADWAKAATKPRYTAAEVGAIPTNGNGGMIVNAVAGQEQGSGLFLAGASIGFQTGTNSYTSVGITRYSSNSLRFFSGSGPSDTANSVQIKNIATPTDNTDAANKQYVDNAITNAAPTISNTLASGTLIATINGTNIYAPAYTDADGVSY